MVNMSYKLYEIDTLLRQAIDEADIDNETGELTDNWADFIDAVQMERDEKALAVAAYIREQCVYSDAIKSEIQRLQQMHRFAQNKAGALKKYLEQYVSPGEKLKNSVVSISWRKSTRVVIDDELKIPDDCCLIQRKPIKSEIKARIDAGINIPAHIETIQNIQIK